MPLLGTPPRSTETERIDAEGLDPDEFSHSLGQVARVDRLLGAERAVRRRLVEAGLCGTVTSLLDVGAGNGEVLARMADWLGERGSAPGRRLALDAHPEVIVIGRRTRPRLTWIRGDGRALPLADDSVDLVLSVLTLHHLDADEAVRMLAEMRRVARHAVLVSDLERSRLHWLGARVLAATLWRSNPLTREDAPTSVLRAWTSDEMRGHFRAAGMPEVDLRRHAPWRLIGIARVGRDGAGGSR